ncbi:MAG: hypothetical protein IJT58_07595 [Synergistaceae bacterium]|nr:hypothetical protein [Synergistaceae bacterium]
MGSMITGRTYTPPVSSNAGIISISFDSSALVRAGIFLAQAPEKAKIAVSHAVNRSLEKFKTIAVRETARRYFVKQKDIRESIETKKSYGGALHGLVISRGHRQPLTKFSVSPKKNPVKQGSFRGAVKRAGGLKPIPLAFLAPFRGDVRAFIRDGKKWRMLMSPSVPQMMKNKQTVAEAEKSSRQVFIERLDHELKRAGFLP